MTMQRGVVVTCPTCGITMGRGAYDDPNAVVVALDLYTRRVRLAHAAALAKRNPTWIAETADLEAQSLRELLDLLGLPGGPRDG